MQTRFETFCFSDSNRYSIRRVRNRTASSAVSISNLPRVGRNARPGARINAPDNWFNKHKYALNDSLSTPVGIMNSFNSEFAIWYRTYCLTFYCRFYLIKDIKLVLFFVLYTCYFHVLFFFQIMSTAVPIWRPPRQASLARLGGIFLNSALSNKTKNSKWEKSKKKTLTLK